MNSTRPDHALFKPEYCLEGIVRCQVNGCGALFQTGESLRACIASLRAQGKSTKCFPTPEVEQTRRRKHAEAHVRAGEATLDGSTGFFLLAEHLRWRPKRLTAADHGF